MTYYSLIIALFSHILIQWSYSSYFIYLIPLHNRRAKSVCNMTYDDNYILKDQ